MNDAEVLWLRFFEACREPGMTLARLQEERGFAPATVVALSKTCYSLAHFWLRVADGTLAPGVCHFVLRELYPWLERECGMSLRGAPAGLPFLWDVAATALARPWRADFACALLDMGYTLGIERMTTNLLRFLCPDHLQIKAPPPAHYSRLLWRVLDAGVMMSPNLVETSMQQWVVEQQESRLACRKACWVVLALPGRLASRDMRRLIAQHMWDQRFNWATHTQGLLAKK
jgi:hypothetical protein